MKHFPSKELILDVRPGRLVTIPDQSDIGVGINLLLVIGVCVEYCIGRGEPNPNNSADSEHIRNPLVPFLINK